MEVLTEEEQQQFREAADKCISIGEAAGVDQDEFLEHESAEAFFELLAGLLEKYEDLSGIQYRSKTFVAEYAEDEDGTYMSGIRWFENDRLQSITTIT